MLQRGSGGGASNVLQQHRARGGAKKVQYAGRRMCAPVGGIYGAFVLPCKLESTRAWQSNQKKRTAAERMREVHLACLRVFPAGGQRHFLAQAPLEKS